MRRWISLLFLVPFLTGCAQSQANSLDPNSCALFPVLLEDFDTLSVSADTIGPARWTAHTPWWGDFGDAKFTDPGPDGPFSVSDGMLSIKAWKDPDGRWRSGLLAAADRAGRGRGTQYGYFETRVKFPPGPGTWPAFWLMPLAPVGSVDGRVEIDVVEYYGHRTNRFHSVIHVRFSDREKNTSVEQRTSVKKGSLVSGFNTFGVDISPSWIVFFLNREEVWRQPTPDALNYPMYPLINLALGSGFSIDKTPDPSIMQVDYVHVFARSARDDCEPGLP